MIPFAAETGSDRPCGRVAELADAAGLKLADRKVVRVRSPARPHQTQGTRTVCRFGFRGANMADLNVTITCPVCGHAAAETMPVDRCVFFWDCPACRSVIRRKQGDCCVYCSYGDKRCPPIQDDRPCPTT
jgi:hypothetical protein